MSLREEAHLPLQEPRAREGHICESVWEARVWLSRLHLSRAPEEKQEPPLCAHPFLLKAVHPVEMDGAISDSQGLDLN